MAKEVGIEKIYYYNISEDRTNNTENYQKLLDILNGHLQYDAEGHERIYVPNVSFHVEGTIVGNDYETSKDTHGFSDPDEYWTEDKVSALKTRTREFMKESNPNICTDGCNE